MLFIDCTKALPAVGGRLEAVVHVASSPSGKHSLELAGRWIVEEVDC
jgi:hypothetical protein